LPDCALACRSREFVPAVIPIRPSGFTRTQYSKRPLPSGLRKLRYIL
jgi:hypothetical protein